MELCNMTQKSRDMADPASPLLFQHSKETLVPRSTQDMVGVTHGTRTSCTLLMTCLPTMMTRSSCASSMRQPPAGHCSSITPG